MINRLFAGIASRLRAFVLRRRGVAIEGAVWLRGIEVPRLAHRISLRAGTALDRGVALIVSGRQEEGLAIVTGRGVYINRYTIIDACQRIEIGDDCMIGPFCYITDHDHTRGADGKPATGPQRAEPVTIEPRAWIGAHVTILKGVSIGAGAVVGAGSVVTKDVPPDATVVGNPARILQTSGSARG